MGSCLAGMAEQNDDPQQLTPSQDAQDLPPSPDPAVQTTAEAIRKAAIAKIAQVVIKRSAKPEKQGPTESRPQ